MIKVFKSYYLFPWVGLALLFLLKGLLGNSVQPLIDTIVTGQIFAFILALIVGTIYFYVDTIWGPKERKKRLQKPPFKELQAIGFKKQDNSLIGKFSGYEVLANYNWSGSSGKPSVSLHILFNPNNNIMDIETIKQLNKKYKKEKIVWGLDNLTKEWDFNFKPPKYEKVYSFLTSAIQILKNEKLQPIKLEQLKEK
ncbi:hypothetical protein GYB57_13445 [bacterium]|nr:hypothetical protein [bacterium]